MKEMKEKEVREVLKRARELIAPEGAWEEGGHALVDYSGPTVMLGDTIICRQWSLFRAVVNGAKSIAAGERSMPFADAAVARLVREIGEEFPDEPDELGELLAWSEAEDRTHAEVLALLDRAIIAA